MNTSIKAGIIILGIVMAAVAPNVFAKLSAAGPVTDAYRQSQWDAYEHLIESSVNGNNPGAQTGSSPQDTPVQYVPSSNNQSQASWDAYQKLVESSVNPNQPRADSARQDQWIEYQRLVQTSVNRNFNY